VIVNPLIVEGQLHGGIVQGIKSGPVWVARYDESGQLLTGSFMDYGLPRADDVPSFVFIDRGRARDDQRARRQRLRRSGLRGIATVGDERRRRRLVALWRASCGYAGERRKDLAAHRRGEAGG